MPAHQDSAPVPAARPSQPHTYTAKRPQTDAVGHGSSTERSAAPDQTAPPTPPLASRRNVGGGHPAGGDLPGSASAGDQHDRELQPGRRGLRAAAAVPGSMTGARRARLRPRRLRGTTPRLGTAPNAAAAPATASGSSLPSVLPYPLNPSSPKERWRGRRLRRERVGSGPIWKPQRPQRQSHRHRRTRSRRRRCPISRARHLANRANRRSRARPVRWEPSSGAALAVHGPYSQSCGPSGSISVRSAGRGSLTRSASRFCWSVAASSDSAA
jgi:hypothetical protein